MTRSDLSIRQFPSTFAGLTRLLLVLLFAPGVVAGALVAGALALCLLPLSLLGRRAPRGLAFETQLSPVRSSPVYRRSVRD